MKKSKCNICNGVGLIPCLSVGADNLDVHEVDAVCESCEGEGYIITEEAEVTTSFFELVTKEDLDYYLESFEWNSKWVPTEDELESILQTLAAYMDTYGEI